MDLVSAQLSAIPIAMITPLNIYWLELAREIVIQ